MDIEENSGEQLNILATSSDGQLFQFSATVKNVTIKLTGTAIPFKLRSVRQVRFAKKAKKFRI